MLQRLSGKILVTLLVAALSSCAAFAASPPANLQSGIDLYTAGSYSAAAAFFEQSLKTNPSNPTAYYYAALCFAQTGQRQRAKDTYSLIVKYFPDSPEAKNASVALRSLPAGSSIPIAVSTFKPATTSSISADVETLPDSDSVPFTRIGGTIYVEAVVNGRPLRMIFDTGADHVQIGTNHVPSLKAAAAAGHKATVHGIGGSSTVSEATAEISLGKITRKCSIMIQDNMITEPLLGQTFFAPFLCQFDNSAGLIRFYKRASKSYSAGYDTIEVPYSQSGNNLVVFPKIFTGNGEYKIPMILDTGAERTMISRMMVPNLSIPADARMYRVSGISGSESVVEVPVQKLELGAISKVGMRVLIGNSMFSLLGQDFFGDRKYTVDPEKHVIRFNR